ncbi:hypothetical protein [Comamonas sp. C24C]
MTNEKLLKLAAKAAGMILGEKNGGWFYGESGQCGESMYLISENKIECWNPLRNDSDALKLAVKLNIEFACFDREQKTNAGVWTSESKPYTCMTPYNGDKHAAVRLAIVRAAAAIQQVKENTSDT